MSTDIHLNRAALERVAESAAIKKACKRAGGRIADAVRDQGITVGDVDRGKSEYPLPVNVEDDGTVLLAHAAGVAVQAKHGALTRAAAAAGFEVRS